VNWLRKFLGLDIIIESKDCEIASLHSMIQDLNNMILYKDSEIKRLTDLMLTEHGIINEANLRPAQTEKQPINARYSWPKRQRELEKKDRELAKNLTSEVEDYWKKKNSEAEAEGLEPSKL